MTDHKTGKPPEKIPATRAAGVCLQPLLYGLAAEQLLGANVESGRLFYATQRGGYQQIGDSGERRARGAFLAKLLPNIDGAIAAGFLPPVAAEGRVRICDYRAVCGPYEELRAARRRIGRMNGWTALIEIRGYGCESRRRASGIRREARERIRKSLDESLIVEASAGTGKTTELVKRIVAVLATGRATIEQIAAVTFTQQGRGRAEAAAARGAGYKAAAMARKAALEDALERLEEASIGTIHSSARRFCGSGRWRRASIRRSRN